MGKQGLLSSYYVRSAVALLLALTTLFLLYYSVSGYKWVVRDIAVANLKYIWQYPDLSIEKKWRVKNGNDYQFLGFIKEHTAENAVIWMPPDEHIHPDDTESPFTRGAGGIKNKAWSYYYLYPRKLVYERSVSDPDTIDYVVIVNGKGYERLTYDPAGKVSHTVLPMRK